MGDSLCGMAILCIAKIASEDSSFRIDILQD